LDLRKLGIQFVAFSWIGALSTGLHFLSLGLLVEQVGLDPVVASCTGFLVLVLLNYYLNYRYTFRSDVPHVAALPRFAVVSMTGLVINASLMYILHSVLDVNYWIAQTVATGTVLVWNFCGNLMWSFRGKLG
jgi:putative flippase GtrA